MTLKGKQNSETAGVAFRFLSVNSHRLLVGLLHWCAACSHIELFPSNFLVISVRIVADVIKDAM